jgi:Tol biopolymer transport system component
MQKLFLMALIVPLLAACSAFISPTADQAAIATLAEEMLVQHTQTASNEAIATPAPLEQPAIHPLASLVYLYDDRLWLINSAGEPQAILHQASYASPSTDGQRVLYAAGDPSDIYLKDLATGEVRQLTDTPGVIESTPRFAVGSSWVIYHFMPADQMGPWSGYLGAVDLQTGETRILDAQNGSGSPYALARDGAKIAYGGDSAWVFSWSSGAQKMEMASFNLNLYKIFFDSATWSPDSQQVAWTIRGEFMGQGDYQAGVVIFDLASRTHYLIHNYALTAGSGFSNPISWSPDGGWLAAVLHNDQPGRRSSTLWLMKTNDSQQHSVSDASNPVWKPDSATLVYTQWPEQGDGSASLARIMAMQIGAWTSEPLSLPPASVILDWIRLP